MTVQPTDLKLLSPDRLQITWSDGEVREYAVRELRDNCPCASCLEKRRSPPPPSSELPVISQAEAAPLQISAMKPTGHYAYSIEFSDGHDTGLFTLEHLRELGTAIEN